MKKKRTILACVWCAIVGLPVLVTFSEGYDGGPTIWNFVGVAYIFLLYRFRSFFFPGWVSKTVDELVRDE